MIQRVDLVAQSVPRLVDRGVVNLDAGRDACVNGKRRDQTRLFGLDAQIRKQNLAEQPRSLSERARAPLRSIVRVSSHVRVAVLLHGSEAEPRCDPLDKGFIRHGYHNDGMDAAVPQRADGRDVDGPLPVDQTGQVCTFFRGQSDDGICRPSRLTVCLETDVARSVVHPFPVTLRLWHAKIVHTSCGYSDKFCSTTTPARRLMLRADA